MFKPRRLIGLAMVLIFGILIYNYFLGTPSEKEGAKETFSTIWNATKDVGQAIGSLVKSEKDKFDDGKYDEALDKIGDLFKKMKKGAEDLDTNYLSEIESLETERKALEEKITTLKNLSPGDSTIITKDVSGDFQKIYEDAERLIKKMEAESQQ